MGHLQGCLSVVRFARVAQLCRDVLDVARTVESELVPRFRTFFLKKEGKKTVHQLSLGARDRPMDAMYRQDSKEDRR